MRVALAVYLVPFRVTGAQHVVPRGVVADPVEDHVQAEAVRGGDEVLEVVQRAEFGIDGHVVAHA
jgi:hypothetical protein